MQRVSLGVAELIDELTSPDFSGFEDSSAAELVSRLTSRGFLSEVQASASQPFSADWTAPPSPIVRTLSIEYSGLSCQEIALANDCAVDWHKRYGLLNVILYSDGSDLQEIFKTAIELASRARLLLVDIVIPDDINSDPLLNIEGPEDNVRISSVPRSSIPGQDGFRIPPINRSSFFCRQDYYYFARAAGESYGCIHVAAHGGIFPDAFEKTFIIGDLSQLSSDSLIGILDRGSLYWRITKDLRARCQECEFRYACPNPVSARSDVADLRSQPSNCSYSPKMGAWM